MSSKGQIVIPQKIREELGAYEGSVFVVLGSKDYIVLKKIEMPSKEALLKNLERLAVKGRQRAERLGIKESDVDEIVHAYRRSKRN